MNQAQFPIYLNEPFIALVISESVQFYFLTDILDSVYLCFQREHLLFIMNKVGCWDLLEKLA